MSAEIQKTETPKGIKGLLAGEQFKQQVAASLPAHLKPDRFIRIALTALTRTPKLLDCTPESFFKCLLDLSALGIEPDGRRAHLIPYGTACTLILDYKGIAELIMRSGLVSNLHADIICDKDEFEFDCGRVTKHKINFREDRGAMYAAYSIARMKDGTEKADVMTKAEIDAIRKRSRAGTSGPWQTDYNEMAKKTVFRRLSKWLPLSPELRDAVEKDDDQVRFDNAQIVTAEVVPSRAAAILAAKQEPAEPPAAAPQSPPEAAQGEKPPDASPDDKEALVKQIRPFLDGPSGAVNRALETVSLTRENWTLASAETLVDLLGMLR